jgi:Tol biopolymer transport system component
MSTTLHHLSSSLHNSSMESAPTPLKRISCLVAVLTCALPVGLSAQQALLTHEVDLEVNARDVVRSKSGILYFVTDAGIRGYDKRTRTSFPVVSGVTGEPAVSNAGDRMAYAQWDSSRVTIWTLRLNPTTGTPIGSPRRLSVRQGRSPEFSPDGRHLAFTVLPATDTAITPRIVRIPVTGGPEHVVAREAGWAQPVRWSPDGQWIYYHHGNGGTHTLRRVSAAGGPSEVLAPGGQLIGFSPDGRWLARIPPFGRRAPENVILISDLNGRDVARFTIPRDAEAIAWGADSGQLVAIRQQSRTALQFVDLNGAITELVPATRDAVAIGVTEPGRLLVRYTSPVDTSWSVIDLTTRSRVAERPVLPSAPPTPPSPRCAAVFDISRQSVSDAFLCDEQGRKVLRGNSGQRVPQSALIDLTRLFKINDNTLVGTTPLGVVTLSLASGERRTLFTLSGPRSMAPALSASADGDWVAANSFHTDSLTQRIHLIPLQGGARRDVHVTGILTGTPIWGPQRRFLLYLAELDARSDVWLESLSGDPPRRLTYAPNGVAMCCVVAPDGSGAAFTAPAGYAVSLWRVTVPPGAKKGGAPE